MNQHDQQRIAVEQALRLLGGSIPDSSYADRVQQIHGLLRLAVWLGLSCKKLEEIWTCAIKLYTEETRSKEWTIK